VRLVGPHKALGNAEQTLQESKKRRSRQSLALLQLGRQRTLNSGALNVGIREITEAAARTLWKKSAFGFTTMEDLELTTRSIRS
jgi:hypothetical protein